MIKAIENKFFIFLFSLLPITIILGQAVSLLNIILISIFIIIKLPINKNFDFVKNKTFILLGIIYLYLLFNTFTSLDYNLSYLRNFGFIRFILLFIAINFFFFSYKNRNFFFKIWTLIILIVIFDSYIEYFLGKNILGYGQDDLYPDRIVSFFKDEPIVAGYLNGFFFIIIGYLLNKKNAENKNLYFLCLVLSLLFFICVTFTGERSNTIKSILALSLFFLLNNKFDLKYRFTVFFSLVIVFVTLISNSNYLKYRYMENIINPILDFEKREKFLNENIYIKHYKSGYAVFQNYPLLGVGNKNYRLETRKNQFTKKNYIPDTHPHQIYLELLSEHGLVGTIILLSTLFFLIFRNVKNCLTSKNSLQLGTFCYLITNFLPVLPSGSFFSDLNMTLFFINFSIFIACNPSSNIFSKSSISK